MGVMNKIDRKEIINMLNIKNGSKEFFDLLHRSYSMSKQDFSNKGYIFAQIGLNTEPCSVNCTFCSMGKNHFSVCCKSIRTKIDIVNEAKALANKGIHALFLMTTADYDQRDFLSVGEAVKKEIGNQVDLVANIGDFDLNYARKLKETGFEGVYHICRLGEGIDTNVSLATRITTLDAIKEAGLNLYYCVEPIGPEHTYEQIADEIDRAIKYEVDIMAVMRRTAIPGTPKEKDGMIDIFEFTKIAAVTRIAVRPKISMNAHETNYMTLIAGINQLYAESGGNPRDINAKTEMGSGVSIETCKKILKDAGYILWDRTF